MRRAGYVSPRRAAKLLGVHYQTIYAWCRRAERGEESPLSDVLRSAQNGYLYVGIDEILTLRRDRETVIEL